MLKTKLLLIYAPKIKIARLPLRARCRAQTVKQNTRGQPCLATANALVLLYRHEELIIGESTLGGILSHLEADLLKHFHLFHFFVFISIRFLFEFRTIALHLSRFRLRISRPLRPIDPKPKGKRRIFGGTGKCL